MRETSSSRFDLGDGLRMCTAPDPFPSRSRVSPSRNLAASAMGLGTRRARLLPYLVSRVFHLRLRIHDVQAHDMSAYTMRRRLYIFMLGIELCSIAWSSPMPGLQTLAGSVSNG